MTQSELNNAVAEATGESAGTIARLGFHVLGDPNLEAGDQEADGPQAYDWDVQRAVLLADLAG